MTLEELTTLFRKTLSENKSFFPCMRTPNAPYAKNRQFSVFSLKQLSEFTSSLTKLPEGQIKHSVRYVVTHLNTLLLAREGKPGLSIPEHKEMSSYVHAAGNLYLTEDFTAFKKIGHESGDFCLDPSSLVWPIALLIAENAPLAPIFTIEIKALNADNQFEITNVFHLTRKELIELLPPDYKTKLTIASNPTTTTIASTPPRFTLRKRPTYHIESSLSLFSHKKTKIDPTLDFANSSHLDVDEPETSSILFLEA